MPDNRMPRWVFVRFDGAKCTLVAGDEETLAWLRREDVSAAVAEAIAPMRDLRAMVEPLPRERTPGAGFVWPSLLVGALRARLRATFPEERIEVEVWRTKQYNTMPRAPLSPEESERSKPVTKKIPR